jgi:hypothetical protein
MPISPVLSAALGGLSFDFDLSRFYFRFRSVPGFRLIRLPSRLGILFASLLMKEWPLGGFIRGPSGHLVV